MHLPKITIIGPESTGKSTLSQGLAEHFGVEWCEEYAREYLQNLGRPYEYPDLLTIAKGQKQLEDKYTQLARERSKPFLVVDTDQYVMKVWCEYVFNQCHTWILNELAEQQNTLYLLCAPDLPWTQDELREYPDERPRQELFHIYRDLLIHQSMPWTVISGIHRERLQKAVHAVNNYL